MSTINYPVEGREAKIPLKDPRRPAEGFTLTLVEPPSLFVSAFRQIRDSLRDPKVTVPAQYYRGEAKLPATDMPPWFVDFPAQIKVAFEKPRDPIGIYNHSQQEKRAICAFAFAVVLGAGGWFWRLQTGLLLGVIAGFALGELTGTLIFKNRPYPPDIWHDYRMQAASWVNSVLVHAIALTLLLLPFYIARMWQPVKAATKVVAVDISPYLPLIPPAGQESRGRRRRW